MIWKDVLLDGVMGEMCDFNWDFKHGSVLHCHDKCGNPFQIRGPVTEKRWCPNVHRVSEKTRAMSFTR